MIDEHTARQRKHRQTHEQRFSEKRLHDYLVELITTRNPSGP
jgi:hypothetical protein